MDRSVGMLLMAACMQLKAKEDARRKKEVSAAGVGVHAPSPHLLYAGT